MSTEQPAPVPNDEPSVQGEVIKDMHERMKLGLVRYGTLLQPHNGRDMLRDAYEEALDLAVYLRGAIMKRDARGEIAPTAEMDAIRMVAAVMRTAGMDKLRVPEAELLIGGELSLYFDPLEQVHVISLRPQS